MDLAAAVADVSSFFFVNKACYRRTEEIGTVWHFFRENHWTEASAASAADVVVLFTCAFCQSKTTDMLQELGRLQPALKPGAELIVGCCLPKIDPERLRTVFSGRVIHSSNFSALDSLPGVHTPFSAIIKKYGDTAVCVSDEEDARGLTKQSSAKHRLARTAVSLIRSACRMAGVRRPPEPSSDKVRYILLAAGCRRQCSYCAIRFATGRLRSKPLDWVLWQFRDSLDKGCGKFELLADSIGDYGLDIGTDLGELFRQLLAMPDRFTVGIYDLHPSSFLKHFDDILALGQAGKIHRLSVPFQSGNERIVKLMNRPCDGRDLMEKLLQMKGIGGIFLHTAVIIGFPTETDAEFEDTLSFLKSVDFDDTAVHFHSDMPGTKSAAMDGKITKQFMRGRLNALLAAGIKNNLADTQHELDNIPD
jgi:tRNA A37 methylthiotransferase MiaB